MASNQQEEVFRFQDLAAELRKEIYGHALTVPGGIHLTGYEVVRGSEWRIVMTDQRQSSQEVQKPTTTMLRLSRATRAEATAIFYGTNTFHFFHPKALTTYMTRIGGEVKLLRQVKLETFRYIKDLHLMKLSLKEATMLRSLTFRMTYMSAAVSEAHMAKALGPLFRAWHKVQKEDVTRKEKKVLDVFQLEGNWTFLGNVETYEEKVKGLIEATLK